MKTPNKPVTRQEMEDFKFSNQQIIGGKVFSHFETREDGSTGDAIFFPNRRERRQYLNLRKHNNRKPINKRGRTVSKRRITITALIYNLKS